VNYDDPEYSVDQGEEVFSVEEEVEEMREDRRRRNDEYQFETYHAKMLQKGEGSFNGEWTTYYTTTFLPGRAAEVDAVNGLPRLVKDQRIRRVISSGKKIPFETDSTWRVDSERLIHEERMVPFDDNDDDTDEDVNSEYAHMDEELVGNPYWPAQMSSNDFRGEQGNMCVGEAYTICDSIPLSKEATDVISSHEGPFSELRTEVGVQYENTRFRVKLDYRALPEDVGVTVPALGLKSMTICRETQTVWPSDVASLESMFYGPPGAVNGLYDPPPVGTDEQMMQYIMLDVEGGATVLFPYRIDQCPNAHNGNGWVTSLDWTPPNGPIRYQVDRKVTSGTGVKGLRTLELSEVQASDADQWRPKDGGENMRQ
jgi:hypothetical protein